MSPGFSPLILFALIALVVVRFLARELRTRKLNVRRIYVVPAILGLLALYFIYLAVQIAAYAAIELGLTCVAALAVGGALGLALDRYTNVRASADPRVILVRGSWATVGIWLAALALRMGGRWALFAAGFDRNTPPGQLGPVSLILNAGLIVMLAVAAAVLRARLVRRARTLTPGTLAPRSA